MQAPKKTPKSEDPVKPRTSALLRAPSFTLIT